MRLLPDLVDLGLSPECAACRHPGAWLCHRCSSDLEQMPVGTVVGGASALLDERRVALAVVRAHKEQGVTALVGPLAAALARTAGHASLVAGLAPGSPVTLVPVPQRRAAARRRGFESVVSLAVGAAALMGGAGTPARVVEALRLVRQPADQRELSAEARRANVAGSMATRPRWRPGGEPIVVVDDVVTTGATLAEAVRALVAGGADPVGSAAVAGVPPPTRAPRHPLSGESSPDGRSGAPNTTVW